MIYFSISSVFFFFSHKNSIERGIVKQPFLSFFDERINLYNLLKRQFEYIKSLILVIYCYIKNYQKKKKTTTADIFILQTLWVRNSGVAYLGSSSWVFHDVEVNMLARAAFTYRLVQGYRVCFQKDFLACCGMECLEQPVSRCTHTWTSPQRCLTTIITTHQLASPGTSMPRESKQEVTGWFRHNLQSHTHHFCPSLCIRSESL